LKLAWIAAGTASMAIALAGRAHAKPAAKHPTPPRPAPRPAPPIPMLPSVGQVTIDVARDRVVVAEDIRLPRGDWASGGLDFFVAFGAPGTPLALDARIAPEAGVPAASAGEASEAVEVEASVHLDASARPLLGSPRMAGVVVRLKEEQLQRVYARGDVATLRLRSLLQPPPAGSDGSRDVVVRIGTAGTAGPLGPEGAQPLTLGRVEVRSLEARTRLVRAEASLCGPEADPWPLSVTLTQSTQNTQSGPPSARAAPREPRPRGLSPELAVRHPSDDLCVRWWTR
jgi:hypothetical protein